MYVAITQINWSTKEFIRVFMFKCTWDSLLDWDYQDNLSSLRSSMLNPIVILDMGFGGWFYCGLKVVLPRGKLVWKYKWKWVFSLMWWEKREKDEHGERSVRDWTPAKVFMRVSYQPKAKREKLRNARLKVKVRIFLTYPFLVVGKR